MNRQIAIVTTLTMLGSGALVALADSARANNFAVTYVNEEAVDTARARWMDTAGQLCANDLAFDDWPTRASVRKPNGDVATVRDAHPGDGPTCRAISVRENATIKIRACRDNNDGPSLCSRWVEGTS